MAHKLSGHYPPTKGQHFFICKTWINLLNIVKWDEPGTEEQTRHDLTVGLIHRIKYKQNENINKRCLKHGIER